MKKSTIIILIVSALVSGMVIGGGATAAVIISQRSESNISQEEMKETTATKVADSSKNNTNANTTNNTKANNSTKTNNTISSTTNSTNTTTKNTQTASKVLTPARNKDRDDDDLPLGFEFVDLKVNGKDIRVHVDTTGDSKQQKNGPYYINYVLLIGAEILKEGKYHLEGYGITMLKEYDIETEVGHNYEFFERDFTATVHKGQDGKEYVAISIPAGVDDKNQASLVLATDDGKLLGDFTVDIVEGINLTGKDVDKYKNWSGDVVFNSIKNGKVTYLTPTEAMYKKDSKGNKVLDTSKDVIELEEHSLTIKNSKVTDKKTNEIYKITNAKNKALAFNKIRIQN